MTKCTIFLIEKTPFPSHWFNVYSFIIMMIIIIIFFFNNKTLLKHHNIILTEMKRKPKKHSSKLLSFKISFSIKHGISI